MLFRSLFRSEVVFFFGRHELTEPLFDIRVCFVSEVVFAVLFVKRHGRHGQIEFAGKDCEELPFDFYSGRSRLRD